MSATVIWQIVTALAFIAEGMWLFPAIVVYHLRQRGRSFESLLDREWGMRLICWCAVELKGTFWPSFIIITVDRVRHGGLTPWSGIQIVAAYFCWHFLKDIGDDRWKRRRRKLSERVSRVGARLVVVPVRS